MNKQTPRLLIGAHVSISGGLEKAIQQGEELNATTIQIFTKSNRQWHAKNITQEEANRFNQVLQQSSINPVVAHATYLINIGSANPEIEKKSVQAVLQELDRCQMLTIPYLILHPGSHTQTNETECLDRIARNLQYILDSTNSSTSILLEIMAGQGSSVCYTFEQLAYILDKITAKKRIGICFDTCHAFAAGYNFSTPQQYEAMWHTFDTTIGLDKLKVLHINDSKKERGSHVDRHEHIGKGKIGLEAFRLIFNDPRFFDIPKILETPKGSLKEDKINMTILTGLLSDKTKKDLHFEAL